MSQILGHTLPTETGRQCVVERLLGGSGQGEVYQVRVDGQPLALKWYFPQQATPQQRALLQDLVRRGAPTGTTIPMGARSATSWLCVNRASRASWT